MLGIGPAERAFAFLVRGSQDILPAVQARCLGVDGGRRCGGAGGEGAANSSTDLVRGKTIVDLLTCCVHKEKES